MNKHDKLNCDGSTVLSHLLKCLLWHVSLSCMLQGKKADFFNLTLSLPAVTPDGGGGDG